MMELDQAMTIQDFNGSEGTDGTAGATISAYLLSSAQVAVKRQLDEPVQSPQSDQCGNIAGSRNTGHHDASQTLGSGFFDRVVSLPPTRVPPTKMVTLHALQEWEGHVVHIEGDAFEARLIDLTAGMAHETWEATIPFAEISTRDVANLEIGSIFRWVIGYELSPEGTRKRVSQIVFRDLPRMTESDLRAGRDWAARIAPMLNP